MSARRLLLVEDEKEHAALIQTYLDFGGGAYKVVHRRFLGEAIDCLRTEAFDVVVLDLGLPDCAGLEVVMRVRDADASVPVLVLTNHEADQLGSLCIQAGADDFIPKSAIGPEQITTALEHAITRREQAGQREMEAELVLLNRCASLPPSGEANLLEPEYTKVLDEFFSSGDEAGLWKLAHELGEAGTSPEDLLHAHSAMLRARSRAFAARELETLVRNSRGALLIVMTQLAGYYQA